MNGFPGGALRSTCAHYLPSARKYEFRDERLPIKSIENSDLLRCFGLNFTTNDGTSVG